ncbi:hypothetical protein BvCmsKKP036_02029 [Escherichia coli]|nr:hypothetical protein BvCmsKKP036_02029 [Escherichia coli]
MGVVEINRNRGIPEVLVVGNRVHLFIVAGAHHVRIFRIQILAHGHVVFFREAVSGEGDAAVQFVKVFGIAHAERVAVQRAIVVGGVLIQADMRVCDVKGHRAKD